MKETNAGNGENQRSDGSTDQLTAAKKTQVREWLVGKDQVQESEEVKDEAEEMVDNEDGKTNMKTQTHLNKDDLAGRGRGVVS